MLGKKTQPMIRNLISSRTHAEVYNVTTSPINALDFIKIQSPRGLKNYGAVGVGLGIVAALDQKSGDCGTEIHATTKTLYSRNLNRSHRISVKFSGRNGGGDSGELDKENYTYVTSYGPNKKSHTRVYYDGCENSRTGFDRRSTKSHRVCIFDISPATSTAYPVASDYLSSCHLCRKKLHGEDIYMYRGEKAFCSTECRNRQIVMDERTEKSCNSQASRSAPADDASISAGSSRNSTINGHQIFSAGIFAI